jgi:aminoglycoside phosphotransferase family enzyme
VIGSHERGNPLSPPRIRNPLLPPAVQMRVIPPRNLRDRVRVQPPKSNLKAIKSTLADFHHATSLPCPRRGRNPPSTTRHVRQQYSAQRHGQRSG